jgi:hypothetical protein
VIGMASNASSSNPIAPPANYGQFITVKMTSDNFLLWQAQILPYLHSQCLIGFVTGATPCPKSTIPAADKDAAPVPNPAYDLWFEQDQAILSAILSSLSPEVLSQCLFLKKVVWDKLDGLYASQSRASAMQIRMQLANLKKCDLSAVDYYNHIKSLTDVLAAAGAPLHDDEIIVYLLTGLPEEYNSMVTSVTTRAEPMSLSDVYTNLISFDNCLLCCTSGTGPQPNQGPILSLVVLVIQAADMVAAPMGTAVATMEADLLGTQVGRPVALAHDVRSMVVLTTLPPNASIAMTMGTRRRRNLRRPW